VTHWIDDPRIDGWQVGWVREPTTAYVRAVRRIALCCRKKNGQWGWGDHFDALPGQCDDLDRAVRTQDDG